MSSTSLSTAPSHVSPWRLPADLPLAPTNAEAGPSDPSLLKRRRSDAQNEATRLQSPSTRPGKRVRQGTPVPAAADEVNSLAPAAPETEAYLSGLSVPDVFASTATGLSSAPFEIDLTIHNQLPQTSEGERSILFSDQKRGGDEAQDDLARLVDEECLSPNAETATAPLDAGGDKFREERGTDIFETGDFAPDPEMQDGEGEDEEARAAMQESQDLNDLEDRDRDGGEAMSAEASLFLPASTIASGSAGPAGSSRPAVSSIAPLAAEARIRPQAQRFGSEVRVRGLLYPTAATDGIEEEDLEVEDSGSYHSGDSSEFEMDYRPVLERTAVKHDIGTFVDGLGRSMCEEEEGVEVEKFKVVDRLGEGECHILKRTVR